MLCDAARERGRCGQQDATEIGYDYPARPPVRLATRRRKSRRRLSGAGVCAKELEAGIRLAPARRGGTQLGGPLLDLAKWRGIKGIGYAIHPGIWSYGCNDAFAAELCYILRIRRRD